MFNYKYFDDLSIELIDGDRGKNYPKNDEMLEKGYCLFLNAKNVTLNGFVFDENVFITKEKDEILRKGKLNRNDIVLTTRGTIGNVGLYDDKITYDNVRINSGMLIIRNNDNNINTKYLYYQLTSPFIRNQIFSLKTGSAQPQIPITVLKKLKLIIPDKRIQDKIVRVMDSIINKLTLNNEINNNLEEQLRLFFEEDILKKLNNENTYECSLYDQFDVIDNRGKTPPLVEYSQYPIIDVKVLSGTERVINYNNCLKYVSKETYDTFFRSGHPKLYDALLSTVGSLAELKIYLENIGTIAQNVVALRPKNDYPLFMYQYILSLKQRLTSYDIGSVQPSIKVTQFMKEIIKIPKDKDLIYKFENLANANTFKMKNLMMENRYLEQLRDTLLPKLMNGEIDLDNIEI